MVFKSGQNYMIWPSLHMIKGFPQDGLTTQTNFLIATGSKINFFRQGELATEFVFQSHNGKM